MANKRPNALPDFIEYQKRRSQRFIDDWQSALRQAENVENPVRTRLYDIYDDVLIDAHLTSQLEKRIASVKGSTFNVNGDDGKPDEDKKELLETPWFLDFLEETMNSINWGHSLLQLGGCDENGLFTKIDLVARRHVIPEKGIVINKVGDTTGINYREDKKYAPWLIEVGKNKDLGILNKATPHVLYKRFAQGAWAEFCEKFAAPLRVGKTEARDTQMRNDMAEMLANMGTAGWMVMDKDDEIELKEAATSEGDVYANLMGFSNAEVSKLVCGSVAGEASQGGSRAKEEVALKIQALREAADLQFIETVVNHILFPKLINLGYDLVGAKFSFEQSKDLAVLWKMVSEMLEADYVIDPEWIMETFGVPVEAKPVDTGATAKGAPSFFA